MKSRNKSAGRPSVVNFSKLTNPPLARFVEQIHWLAGEPLHLEDQPKNSKDIFLFIWKEYLYCAIFLSFTFLVRAAGFGGMWNTGLSMIYSAGFCVMFLGAASFRAATVEKFRDDLINARNLRIPAWAAFVLSLINVAFYLRLLKSDFENSVFNIEMQVCMMVFVICLLAPRKFISFSESLWRSRCAEKPVSRRSARTPRS